MTQSAPRCAALLGASILALVCVSPCQQQPASDRIRLVYADFDPLVDTPRVPPALRADGSGRLWIVQLAGGTTDAARDAIAGAGGELHGYLPDHAYVVRADAGQAVTIRDLADVRWVGRYEPAYRLEPFLLDEHRRSLDIPARLYNIVVVDKQSDKPALEAHIRRIGGTVTHRQPGSLLLQARLTGAQLIQAVHLDQVLWIDRWHPPAADMDHGRNQGGADYVESIGGYTGAGVRGHSYEGLESTHPDFNVTPTVVRSCSTPEDHGHAVAGIIAGNGTSNSKGRGMAPDVRLYFTNYLCQSASLSRWQIVQELVGVHNVMFTTASWGDVTLTTQYTSTSAEADDIVFDHDIPWTQSQSNSGSQLSRAQAWAKNVFSVGGVAHNDNADRSDDSWAAGNASIGPAADGRIKPDLCAYYDWILTSDLFGAAGYSATSWTKTFGGTSGATPMVAGTNALAIQMFTDGLFGSLRVPRGTRFENRPHFTTLKALQIAHAMHYPFTSVSTDNRREHVGWGFPDACRPGQPHRDANPGC